MKMFRTSFNEEKKLWSGIPFKLDSIRETCLGIEILNSLKLHGSKVAEVEPEFLFLHLPSFVRQRHFIFDF